MRIFINKLESFYGEKKKGYPQSFVPLHLATKLQVSSTETYMPTWGYTRNKNEVFVIGGSPQLMITFTKSIVNGKNISKINALTNNVKDIFSKDVPYAAKINSVTLEKTILKLDRGKTVNYTGGLVMHANGYVNAVSQSVLYKIDPEKMEIVKSVELPKIGNNLTSYWITYNGLQVLNNGELVLKGFHLLNNAELDGYLLLVDPEIFQIDIKQKTRVSSARLAIEDNYLYHVNAEENIKASASPAISAANGQVYIDDYKNGRDNFVVLDLLRGEELGRVKLSAALPMVGTILIGENNDVFILSSEAGNRTGYVSRITVK